MNTGDRPGGHPCPPLDPPSASSRGHAGGFAGVDAASCAALGAHLVRGARRLREAAGPDSSADVSALAHTMHELGTALTEFADAARQDRPTRPGLPHPRTALRTVARDVVTELGGRGGPNERTGHTGLTGLTGARPSGTDGASDTTTPPPLP